MIHYYLIWFGVITILFYLLGRTSFMRIYRIVLRIVLLTLSVVCIDRAAIYIVFWKVKDYSVLMCFTLFIVWEYIYRSIEVVWYHRLWGPCYYCTLVLAKIYYYPTLSTFTTIKDHLLVSVLRILKWLKVSKHILIFIIIIYILILFQSIKYNKG